MKVNQRYHVRLFDKQGTILHESYHRNPVVAHGVFDSQIWCNEELDDGEEPWHIALLTDEVEMFTVRALTNTESQWQ